MHCLRRAAGRLLSAQVAIPVRQNWAATGKPSHLVISRRLPQPALQSRWNSGDAKPELKIEPELKTEPRTESEPKSDAALNTETESKAKSELKSEEELTPEPERKTESQTETDAEVGDESVYVKLDPDESLQSEIGETPGIDLDQIRAAAKGDPELTQKAFESALNKNAKQEKRTMILKNGFDPKETIYVGNLFFDVTSEDLKEQFSKYGTVEEINIIHDNRGISKGFGYVQFDSISAARRAIAAMHLRIFEGRRIVTYFAQNNMRRRKADSPASKTLYIGNMAFEMTDRDINHLFKDVVNVIDVRVSVDRRTGQPRGFAHAEFVDTESAQAALEILSQKAPYGRKLRIDFSNSNRTAFPV